MEKKRFEALLPKCPICGQPAQIMDDIQDFFIFCSEGCTAPRCFHHRPEHTALSWRDFVCWYESWPGRKEMATMNQEKKQYQWEKTGLWLTDGHAWMNGVDLGQCEKEATGERVVLSSLNPEFGRLKERIQVECQVYRVNMQISCSCAEEKTAQYVYIAIGRYKYAPILFRDELSMDTYFEFVNRNSEEGDL